MKRRLSAILLAVGLSVSALSIGVCAAETETEQVTETVTEVATEAAAETEAAVEETEAALTEAEEAVSEVTEEETAAPETQSQEEVAKEGLTGILEQISSWTDEQIEEYVNGDNASYAGIAANWSAVKGELGKFVEVTTAEMSQDATTLSVTGTVSYEDAADSTEVIVSYSLDQMTGKQSIEWDVKESMGTKMKKAGLNTLMGVGIVFLALLFLSVLIGKLHYIPDMIEARAKKNAPAPAPVPAPVAVPVPVAPVVEEDLTDDLELVAVITAAIAASENTSSDGFVVRSIKKANKRNWHRA